MTDQLPPLPEPDSGSIQVGREEVSLGYSAEQMCAYAQAAIKCERDGCAQSAEGADPGAFGSKVYLRGVEDGQRVAAAAVRART